jgi:hypothetical protein
MLKSHNIKIPNYQILDLITIFFSFPDTKVM